MNPWRGLKDLPREMWIIAGGTLLNRTGTMVLPFLALYLTTKIDLSPDRAGLIITFYGIGSLITAPFIGKLADKFGAFLIMKLSLFLAGIVLLFYPLFHGYFQIMAVTILWAIINEAYRPANMSLISHVVNAEQRRTAFALNRLVVNLGMSIGPVVAGFLVLIDYSIIFYVDAATSILASGFLFFFRIHLKNNSGKISAEKAFSEINGKSAFRDLGFLYFLAAMLPASMVIFQHMGAMPIYIVRGLKFSPSVFGLLAMINTILIILVEVPLNIAMSKWSERSSLALGAFLIAAGFGALAYASTIPAIAATIVIWTFGEMIFFPSTASYIAEVSPPEKRGEYMGLFQMLFSASLAFGPWLGTVVYEHFGSEILWISAFLFGCVSVVMIFFLRTKKIEEEVLSEA
ncbi:MAG TPA: MFS transporter [Ignavibacteriaceae bacterium]|nr:MFS transporter [Ignavibacteriaceae bacterium]